MQVLTGLGKSQAKVAELEQAGDNYSSESADELERLRNEVQAAMARATEAETRAKTIAQEKETLGKK